MASIAKLSVQMAWQGSDVTKGAADASKSLKTVGDVADKSKKSLESIGKVKPINISEMLGLKSLNDVKGLLDMAKGVFTFFVGMPLQAGVSILKMGGALETMTIRAQHMAQSVEGGNKVIKDLRDISSNTGVPLEDLAKAFEQFTAAGMSTAGAATILAQTGNAIEILGGGAAGANAVASAITEIRGAAIATDGPLRTLQKGGLRVFEALAKELESVTGNAYSVEDALAAVKDGAVSSATAVRAVFAASNTKEAADTASKMANSFEGMLRQVTAGFNDLLTEIGKQMLAIIQPEKAFAALKGAFQGVKEVVQEIAAAFMPVIDPKDKASGLASIFDSSKQIAKDVVNKLIEGVTQLKTMFDEVVAGIRQLMEDYKGLPTPKGVADAVKFEFTSALPGEDANSAAALKRQDARLKEEKAFDDDFLNMITFGLTGPGVHAKSELVSPAFKPNELMPVVEAKAKADKLNAEIAAKAEATAKAAAESKLAQERMLEAEAAKNLEEETKACTAALEEQARETALLTLDFDNATKDNANMTRDILKNNMSITEKFAETIGNLETMMAQAAKGSKESADKLRAAQTRVVGKQLQDMVKQFATPQAGTAQAFVAGSAGAAEAQIRARVEATNAQADPQKQLVAAAAEAARQDAIQAAQMTRLIAAAEKANIIKPGTLVIPK
jgi:hypothetical protein